MDLLSFTDQIGFFLGLLPLVIYILNRKVNQETVYLLPYIVLMFVVTIFEEFNVNFFKISTIVWFRFYCFLEFYVVFYFFYKILEYKLILKILGCVYFLVYIYMLKDFSFEQKAYDDMPINLIMVIATLYASTQWFIEVFRKMEETPLYMRSVFYYISSLLIFFSGTFLVLLTADFLRAEDAGIRRYWVIISVLNILTRLIIGITVYKSKVRVT